MTGFYKNVLGLKPIYESDKHVFLKVADGYKGHTQLVALFDYKYDESKRVPDSRHTTLHHIAFNLSLEDFAIEKKRLRKLGLDVTEEVHRRSMYFRDPEGNEVELVSYDEKIG